MLQCTSIFKEMEESWLQELETDTENKQGQFFKGLCYVEKKSLNNPHGFPEAWDFSKNGLALQKKNYTYLEANLKPFSLFKPRMNANLQSRLLENIIFIERSVLENKNSSAIGNYNSEFKENNIFFVSKAVFWPPYAEEREKPTLYNNISKQNGLKRIDIVFDDILTENLFERIDPLFKNLSKFQSNKNGTNCHHTNGEQYSVPKSIIDGKTRNDKSPCQYLPTSNIMKERKSDLGSLSYRYENAAERINIFENPKLKKCDLELFLTSNRISGYKTAMEKNYTSVFSNVVLFSTPKREISNEISTKIRTLLSRDSLDYGVFSIVDDNQKARHHSLSKSCLLPENNSFSSIRNKSFCNPRTTHKLTLSHKVVNYLTLASYINEKLCIKYSNHRMLVTMETNVPKKFRFFSNENNAFFVKKFNFSHFNMRAQKKKVTRRFKTNINLTNKSKNTPNWVETYEGQKAVMDRRKTDNFEEYKGNIFGFVDVKNIFSPFETHKKIYLNTGTEEMDQIQFLEKIVFNTEEYSKVSTTSDSKITWSVTDAMTDSHISHELFTYSNSFLEQKSKSKMFQYYRHKNSNSQRSQHGINDIPVNGLYSAIIQNHFSDIKQTFTSDIFQNLCMEKNIAVSVKARHNKIFLPEKTERQTHYLFETNKGFLPYVHNSRACKRLKHPKVKQLQNAIFLCQKDNLLSNIYNPEQNAKDDIKVDNEIFEKSYPKSGNEDQPSTVPCFDDECTKCSGNKLMTTLPTMKQVHFEKVMEGHFSPEIRHGFEMKKQFASVVEKMNKCENSLSGEENIRDKQSPENGASNDCEKQVNATFSTSVDNTAVMHRAVMKQNKNKGNIFKTTGLKGTEQQELPHNYCSSSISDEELFYSPSEEHCSMHCEQPFSWKPAFGSHSSWKERSYDFRTERGVWLFDGIIRVQPLKTRHGPLRVGLSRKAKLRQLHPYLR